jgi:ribose-phosphate pyrophosphokinase
MPFFAYGRSDKKDQPRVPITARLIANMIETAGADRILTIDLHAGQIQGFFNIPVDELTALYLISRHFASTDVSNTTIVATDVGGAKRARDLARQLGTPLAVVDKERMGNEERISSMALIGDVESRDVIIPDDEILTGGTIIAAARIARENGARRVTAACVHPILADHAVEKICDDGLIEELVVTDTIPLPPQKQRDKITVLTVAPLIGEAITRIHTGQSVGELFQ